MPKDEEKKQGNQDFAKLVKESNPHDKERMLQRTVSFYGQLRKSDDNPESFILVSWGRGGRQHVLEINTADVINYDIIRETSEGDKIVRVFVPFDTDVRMINNVPSRSANFYIRGYENEYPPDIKYPVDDMNWGPGVPNYWPNSPLPNSPPPERPPPNFEPEFPRPDLPEPSYPEPGGSEPGNYPTPDPNSIPAFAPTYYPMWQPQPWRYTRPALPLRRYRAGYYMNWPPFRGYGGQYWYR
jgi:hypothetical protein